MAQTERDGHYHGITTRDTILAVGAVLCIYLAATSDTLRSFLRTLSAMVYG